MSRDEINRGLSDQQSLTDASVKLSQDSLRDLCDSSSARVLASLALKADGLQNILPIRVQSTHEDGIRRRSTNERDSTF